MGNTDRDGGESGITRYVDSRYNMSLVNRTTRLMPRQNTWLQPRLFHSAQLSDSHALSP
jgi:hypothetical protein